MSALPLDDEDIEDAAVLWRRVPRAWMVLDEGTNCERLSSQAFQDSSDGSGTSVILAAESSVEQVLKGYPGFGIAAITAGAARAQHQGVIRVPIVGVPGHAQIEGEKSKRVRRALAEASFVTFPDGDVLPA